MRAAAPVLLLAAGAAAAAPPPDPDPAARWLRADAPHAYLVRQRETARDAALRFVRRLEDWPRVWCPWPGYLPPPPIRPGDLLARVRIDGRSWVQRVRRAGGQRPQRLLLRGFEAAGTAPFAFVPDPEAHPARRLRLDPAALAPRLPPRAPQAQVARVWPATAERPEVVRLTAGRRAFLVPGTALTVPTAAGGRARALVAAAYPHHAFAVLLTPGPAAAGGAARSPAAWCAEP